MLDKSYRPEEVEPRQYARWEEAGIFAAGTAPTAQPYTIMMPPPNVTGSLHMGHALTFTLQDLLVRFHRMVGRDVLWQPGTDHAGIATQMVVERQLAGERQTRHDLGRDGFIERVWRWKDESGGTITRQLRRLGASPDWARERFTMDEGMSEAVRRVFVDLYKQGLIYRDKRLVNWDPVLHTAISDLEVELVEVDGFMWYLRYPIEGEPGRFITVATTRPETMLGDSGVAVHPDDPRYADLIGKKVRLPIVGRLIPIVADTYSDPEKGTGAVKITPAHDFNDFEVGRRHGLALINIFDKNACLNEAAPEAWRGLDRFVARQTIVAALQDLDVVEKIEPHRHAVPHDEKWKTVVIEPWLTDQWFVDAATLAVPAVAAVQSGRTRFVPKQWENTFFEWMRNIQPWCISRQIWWGHQVPAWYGPDGKIFVELSAPEAIAAAERHYGHPVSLTRDEDVLDTWFSSALWPFSTLGWPERTTALERYYPGDVLVTGLDIIFFWVARMMMMGHHFMGDVPFRDVYIHALVRDEKGQKMSKSKGNVIDPLVLIDRYGCDALRFTLVALAAQGRDIKLAEGRVEGSRNFATKLWNAARFCAMNGCHRSEPFDPARVALTLNRWIVTAVSRVGRSVAEAVQAYNFHQAASLLYAFVWNGFCDWYVEFAKPILQGDDAVAQAETRATAAWAMEHIVHFLHPLMPFITEELWTRVLDGPGLLATRPWPKPVVDDEAAAAEMEWLIRLISAVRTVRGEMNVPPSARIPLLIKGGDAETGRRLTEHRDIILALARVSTVESIAEVPAQGALQVVVDELTVVLPVADVIDFAQEKARLTRDLAKVDGELGKIAGKLANPAFIDKAPLEVIEEQRERAEDLTSTRSRLSEALARLGQGS